MFKKVAFVSLAIALFGGAAFAQASRTWVSGVGDDANPCSRTAPCKTFAGAISKTTAAGEIDVLDPGGFGAVTITKAITIDGNNMGSVLVAGTNAIVVATAATDTVIIRNLSIDGLNSGLDGILFNNAGTLIVEHTNIFNFTVNGIELTPSVANIGKLHVKDTNVSGVASVGIKVNTRGTGTLDNVRVESSRYGVYSSGELTVSNSTASGMTQRAFTSTGSSILHMENCVAADSLYGVYADGTIVISNSTVTNNSHGLFVGTGAITSLGNNRIYGNTTDGSPTTTIAQH